MATNLVGRFHIVSLLVLSMLSCISAAIANPKDFVVYAFSQCDVDGEDPQVYDLRPDTTIRAIGKWSNNGSEVEDYNFGQIARYHERNITFMGSGTASVIFPHDFPTAEIFDDMSTRDANGDIVPHDEFDFPIPARRGNFFNPAYRDYLISWAKIQIDGGVDGINFDEVNGGFSGGKKYNFNGNEGFDNYTLADFNRYLLAKYPNSTAADFQTRFRLPDNNLLSRTFPPDNLTKNFNYLVYLRSNSLNLDPHNSSNPLASEWGRPTANRLYATDQSFTATYTRLYWHSLITTLRNYTLTKYRRHLLISSNGLWPYVDFTSIGLYPWNPDENTPDYRGADYVPLLERGHLNGAKSLASQYRYLKTQSGLIAGEETPVAVFIDWPNDMMAGYQALSLTEKMDYWRIFGAEAYAQGIFPAFHLRDTVGGKTANESGVLAFMKEYSEFFKARGEVFKGNGRYAEGIDIAFVTGEEGSGAKKEGVNGLVGTALVQTGTGRRTVHVVNHNYDWTRGGNLPVQKVWVEIKFADAHCPKRVGLISPDRNPVGEVWYPQSSSCGEGKLEVYLGEVKYYSVLLLD